MSTTVLDANVAALNDHRSTFLDPDLVTIDQDLLDGRTDTTVTARWETWTGISRALQDAIATNPQEAARLLGALGDATGDLVATSDTAGFNRGVGLARAMRPSLALPDGISAFETFQMVALPGASVGTV